MGLSSKLSNKQHFIKINSDFGNAFQQQSSKNLKAFTGKSNQKCLHTFL